MENPQQDFQLNIHSLPTTHLSKVDCVEAYKKEFFNNVENLFSFFLELNSELNNLYGECFVNPSILSLGNGIIKQTIKSDKLLTLFHEHFNHFGNYDKFVTKDVEFYKDCLLNEIADTDIIPFFYKTIFKQNINKVFDEGYIEEDHIENFYEHCKKIIRFGILYNNGRKIIVSDDDGNVKEKVFVLEDERWNKIL